MDKLPFKRLVEAFMQLPDASDPRSQISQKVRVDGREVIFEIHNYHGRYGSTFEWVYVP